MAVDVTKRYSPMQPPRRACASLLYGLRGHGRSAAPAVFAGRDLKQLTAINFTRRSYHCAGTTLDQAAAGSLGDYVDASRHALRADGRAALLAIGTANPTNCVPQDEYTDYYFNLTESNHLTHLKDKMKRICQKTSIKKRYFHHTEEMIREHPSFLDRSLPTLDARLDIAAIAVPELAATASMNAICEWGRPASEITHLVVGTYSGAHMPGPDLRLASHLALRPSVHRTMLYYHGCTSGSCALRLAKDIAENNRDARVLVVCTEATVVNFCAPDEVRPDILVIQALFGDGAAAVVVGADPKDPIERPIFEMLSTFQTVIPGTEEVASSQLRHGGMDIRLSSKLPAVIRDNIEHCLVDMLTPLGLTTSGWNNLFWAMHPGGRAILDCFEAALRLDPEKMAASRCVLREFGNMNGVTVLFVLDELRRHRLQEDAEGGQCAEMGVMVSFGPGVTVEMMALRACTPPASGTAGRAVSST